MLEKIKGTFFYRGLRYAYRIIKEKRRSSNWKSEPYKGNYEKLLALKGKHEGQPAVLIGGGPSINKMDLNQFKDMVTIACNGFYLKHDAIDFIPTYYTVEDPLPAEDNSKEISALKGTTKIVPWDLKHFVKPDNETVYINFLRSYMRPSNSDFPLFSNDFENKSYWGGTVMYLNIQLAKFLGCNPIYIIGVDLTYNIPESVEKTGAILTSTEDDENHFDPRYFGVGKKWHVPETARMQKSFTKAFKELKKEKIDLINAGVNSKLQEIPKTRLFY